MTIDKIQFEETQVVTRLKAFFDAMGRWEGACKASYRALGKNATEGEWEKAKSRWIESLQDVFREFCTTHEQPERTRYGIHFSMIPTYGATLEDVISVEISVDRAVVDTKQNIGPMFHLRYRLTKTTDDWRIEDNRKIVRSDGGEDDWDL